MKKILSDIEFQIFLTSVIIPVICLLIITSSYFFWTKILAYLGLWYTGWYTIGYIFIYAYRFLKWLIDYPVNHSR